MLLDGEMSKKQIDNPLVIPFAENLADVYPAYHVGNLALLSADQRAAIAEDNRRWRLAGEIFEKRRIDVGLIAVATADKAIRDGIALMQPDAYREDMRRRLNTIMRNSK